MNDYYQFDPEDARQFARWIHADVKSRGDELQFRICPYCKADARNDKNKFSINLRTGQFHCFRASCGANGNMITLAKDFNFKLSNSGANTYYGIERKYFRRFRKRDEPIEPKDAALAYLSGRGISEAVARKYQITSREHDGKTEIVIPFIDPAGEYVLFKYRRTDPELIEKYGKEYSEKDCKQILFGMFQCDPEIKRLVLTEGQMDALAVAEAGIPNAVSVPTGANGFTWVPNCWDWLQGFEEIVVFGDYEKGRVSLLDEIRKRCGGFARIKYIPPEFYEGCKDANDLLRAHGPEAVRKAIDAAVPVPDERIIDISEIGFKSTAEKEHFSSGIGRMDQLLGGFYMGDLNIITGKRGEGKSTLASQILVRALMAGYPVFAYSGELDNTNFAEWLYRQIAGPEHVNVIRRDGEIDIYTVDENSLMSIRKWIRGKAYLFSSEIIQDGKTEQEAVLDTIRKAVTQYGCRVILVDNLMTAMTNDRETDFYNQQTEFVKDLKLIAKNFDVCVIMVAHPRKTNLQVDNDDISGSANITNLADAVIGYSRPKDDHDSNNRTLTITKNRRTGKIDTKGVKLFFEEKSKRIAMNNRFGWAVGWETEELRPVSELPDFIPF